MSLWLVLFLFRSCLAESPWKEPKGSTLTVDRKNITPESRIEPIKIEVNPKKHEGQDRFRELANRLRRSVASSTTGSMPQARTVSESLRY